MSLVGEDDFRQVPDSNFLREIIWTLRPWLKPAILMKYNNHLYPKPNMEPIIFINDVTFLIHLRIIFIRTWIKSQKKILDTQFSNGTRKLIGRRAKKLLFESCIPKQQKVWESRTFSLVKFRGWHKQLHELGSMKVLVHTLVLLKVQDCSSSMY